MSKHRKTYRALAYFTQIGLTMVASILVGVLIGKFLDGILGTSPWLLLVFSLLGAGAALKSIYDISKDKELTGNEDLKE